MWVAKFKIYHKDCWLIDKVTKSGISTLGVPINSYEQNGEKVRNALIFMYGSAEKQKQWNGTPVRCFDMGDVAKSITNSLHIMRP